MLDLQYLIYDLCKDAHNRAFEKCYTLAHAPADQVKQFTFTCEEVQADAAARCNRIYSTLEEQIIELTAKYYVCLFTNCRNPCPKPEPEPDPCDRTSSASGNCMSAGGRSAERQAAHGVPDVARPQDF